MARRTAPSLSTWHEVFCISITSPVMSVMSQFAMLDVLLYALICVLLHVLLYVLLDVLLYVLLLLHGFHGFVT